MQKSWNLNQVNFTAEYNKNWKCVHSKRKKSSYRKANWKSIYTQIHALFFIFREKLILFFSFFAKKLKTWNMCLKLTEAFLQICTFQYMYFRVILSDTLKRSYCDSILSNPPQCKYPLLPVQLLHLMFSSQQPIWSTIPFQSPELCGISMTTPISCFKSQF